MTLLELQAVENEVYAELKRIEETILKPARDKWLTAYNAVKAAKQNDAIETEVQRRLQERSAK